MEKKGQMKLSFGMIFSIILIIAFIVFAFFAIQKFFKIQDTVKKEKFFTNLETDVNKLWDGSRGKNLVKYNLPTMAITVRKVCFISDNERNVQLLLKEGRDERIIEHLKINNDICIVPENGKVEFYLVKDYGDPLVYVEKI